MSRQEHHTYKIIEITGTSGESIENATQSAIARASQSLKRLRWFEVQEIRGAIDGNQIDEYQVTLKVGFSLEEGENA